MVHWLLNLLVLWPTKLATIFLLYSLITALLRTSGLYSQCLFFNYFEYTYIRTVRCCMMGLVKSSKTGSQMLLLLLVRLTCMSSLAAEHSPFAHLMWPYVLRFFVQYEFDSFSDGRREF